MEMTRKEWMNEGKKLFGKSLKNWKFVCPNCKNIQCYHDFKKLNLDDEKIRGIVYFSCIGRWMEDCKGEIGNKIKPCNYTNGGLFDLSELKIVDEEGKKYSVFKFAKINNAPKMVA